MCDADVCPPEGRQLGKKPIHWKPTQRLDLVSYPGELVECRGPRVWLEDIRASIVSCPMYSLQRVQSARSRGLPAPQKGVIRLPPQGKKTPDTHMHTHHLRWLHKFEQEPVSASGTSSRDSLTLDCQQENTFNNIIFHSFPDLNAVIFLFYIKSCKGVEVVGQTIVKPVKGGDWGWWRTQCLKTNSTAEYQYFHKL